MTDAGSVESERDGVVMKENRHGVEKPHVRVDVGTTEVVVPVRLRNPITERSHDLRNLSDDGYLKTFLAYRYSAESPDLIDVSSSPVLTFDKDRFEHREEDGHHVLVKREAETKFEEMVVENDCDLHTGNDT